MKIRMSRKSKTVWNKRDNDRVAYEYIVVRSLCSQLDRLVIENGLMFRKWTDHVTSRDILQAVVGNSERRKVLKHYHDSRTAGHIRIHQTLARFRQSYYWPGLKKRHALLYFRM